MTQLQLIFPLISSILLLLDIININPSNKNNLGGKNRELVLGLNILNLWHCNFLLFILFDPSISSFQFEYELPFNLGLQGLDGISIWLVWQVTLLSPIIILHGTSSEVINRSFKRFNLGNKGLSIYLLLVQIIIFWSIAVFIVQDTFLFYISFEGVLIPMYYLIVFYGSRNRKMSASTGLLIYTVLGSLFLLTANILLYIETGTSDYQILANLDLLPSVQYYLWLGYFLSLAVKVPMIPFHLWLPEAHVEAPTGISVIQASILLKLGSYGFIRYSLTLFPEASIYFSPMVITLAILGLIYTSFISLAQVDIKKIIAYSSVGHMNQATIGIFSNTIAGLEGSLYFMVSHGFISGGLFLMIGVLYDRYHTRTFKYFRGLALVYPLFSTIFLILTLGNVGVPGTSGFLSEQLTLIGSFQYNPIVGVLSSLTIILAPLYSLWLYNRINFGSLSNHISVGTVYQDMSVKEIHLVLPLLIASLIFGLFPNILINSSLLSILSILY